MAKSDYRYGLQTLGGRNVLVIEDLSLGRCSVTNDIENVIEDIAQKEIINPVEYMIVYRDSRAIWDGYEFATQQFIALRSWTWEEAVRKYVNKQLQ